MREFFWESIQEARKEHFCDWCCNFIQPGQTYRRKIWVPRRGSFHVMNEHDTPSCPPNIGEEIIKEMMRQERAALGVPIAFEVRTREVVVMEQNGNMVVRHEPELVPVILSATATANEYADSEEIPF